jgi:hypothetical protein
MKHAETVPYGWYERSTRNPWFNRTIGKVEMPDTIKDTRNFVLTTEEAIEYDKVLAQMADFLTAERNRMRVLTSVIKLGRHSEFMHGSKQPEPHTMAHVLEFMVRLGHAKLDTMHFLNRLLQRVVALRDSSRAADVTGVTNGAMWTCHNVHCRVQLPAKDFEQIEVDQRQCPRCGEVGSVWL